MSFNSPLFLLCSLAGFLLIMGSLYLVWKGVINLRPDEGVSEMEVSGVGKIKTPVPALIMFILGVILVVFPVYKYPDVCDDPARHKHPSLEIVELRGKVTEAANVEVNAVVDVQEAKASDSFTLSVPYVENRRYVVRYMDTGGTELRKESFILKPGEKLHSLNGMEFQGSMPPAPTLFKSEQSESKETVAEFNK